LGRWINRDPIAEEGGVNLYAFVMNVPACYVDTLGQSVFPGCTYTFIYPGNGDSSSYNWVLVADSYSALLRHWDINVSYDLPGSKPNAKWNGKNIQLSPFFKQRGIVLDVYDQPKLLMIGGWKEYYKLVASKKFNDYAHKNATIMHELIGVIVTKYDRISVDAGGGSILAATTRTGVHSLSMMAEFAVLAGERPGYVTSKMLKARNHDYGDLPLSTQFLRKYVSDYKKAIDFVCSCENGTKNEQVFKSTPYARERKAWFSPKEKIRVQSWLKCQNRKISDGGVDIKLWQWTRVGN
jgi:hypothetical protein